MADIKPVLLRGSEIRPYADENGNVIEGSPKTNGQSIVEFRGSNCRVVFGENSRMYGQIAFQRDGSYVSLGDWAFFRGRTSLGLDCRVTFGYNVYCGVDLQVNTAEGQDITIGDDVLIANHCRIRADDSHPIYDGVTGDRLNHSRSIVVEDHVWIGQEVFIMPGAHVQTGSIIGARSMVTRSSLIPPHSLAFGSPATVRRSKVHWVRKHTQNSFDLPARVEPIFGEVPIEPEFGSFICNSCNFRAPAHDMDAAGTAAVRHMREAPSHGITLEP
ncbi:hypothetical protein C4K88_01360 [Arthrobacter pityocampae]|uniref:Acetyltransferase n=1 Tax=Arthrobacter pityocampae TaxID=547334 RepID=A0A2S5J194_9MICC|nr:acyltransferase [Arthrobacter pityocampae]PPB50567.1 hypothetical protein C4K88_01360 [Arthrobacter pityocampae]